MTRVELISKEDTLAENKGYRICRFHLDDRKYYEALWSEIPISSKMDEDTDKKVMEQSWRKIFETGSMCKYKIMDKESTSFVGSIEIREVEDEMPELGIQLLKKYQGKGIGTEVMDLFLDALTMYLPGTEYIMRIRSNNEVSKRMAQKLGAVECGAEGLDWVEFYKKIVEEIGEEQFESVIGSDFESTQQYIICYKITRDASIRFDMGQDDKSINRRCLRWERFWTR